MNSEQILLGLVFRDPDIWYLIEIRQEFFLDHVAKDVCQAIQVALKSEGYLSRETIVSSLRHERNFDECVHAAESYNPSQWRFHRDVILRKWKQRQIGLSFLETKDELDMKDADPDELIETLMASLNDIRAAHGKDTSISFLDASQNALRELQKAFTASKPINGIESSLRGLDGVLGGLRGSRLIYVGARPSQGKSALIGQMADHVARKGVKVGFISLESGAAELIQRTWARRLRINSMLIQSGVMKPEHMEVLKNESENNIPIWISDRPNQSISQVTSQAHLWKAKYNIDILVIDYLQLIRVPKKKDKREVVEEASITLKDLSRQLDIPVVCAAQLRREVDGRKPHLGDFQHSSQAEQDADVAILLHWISEEGVHIPVDLIVAKNRDGAKTTLPLMFFPASLRFEERREL